MKKVHYDDNEVLGHVSDLLSQLADVPMEDEEPDGVENGENFEEENDEPM